MSLNELDPSRLPDELIDADVLSLWKHTVDISSKHLQVWYWHLVMDKYSMCIFGDSGEGRKNGKTSFYFEQQTWSQ